MTESLTLISYSTSRQDVNGYAEVAQTRTEVFCKPKSPTRAEFYQAQRAGIAVAQVFVISRWNYNGETSLEYEGKTYKVERTYELNVDEIELTCSEVV